MIVRNNTSGNYIQKRRDLTLAIFHRDNPTSNEMGVPNTCLDNETYLSRRVGDMYLAAATAPALPVYTITCRNNLAEYSLDPPLPTTPFFISPAQEGTGVAQVYYYDNLSNSLYTVVISTTQKTLMPVPPQGTIRIEYVFPCNPSTVDLRLYPFLNSQSWLSFKFKNTNPYPVTVFFTPESIPSQTLAPNETSPTVTGITHFETVGLFTFGSDADPEIRYPIYENLICEINSVGTVLAIQNFDENDTLISTLRVNSDSKITFIVPAQVEYFTSTPAFIYQITDFNGGTIPYTQAPMLLVRTFQLYSGESVIITYYNSDDEYIDDGPVFLYNQTRNILVVSPPPDTAYLKYELQG